MLSKLDYFVDPNFTFDQNSHTYCYINPETKRPVQFFESVSGFIGQFKTPFDAQKISRFVAKKKGVPQQQILDEWAATAKEGTDLGSYVHEWIEDYYNGNNPNLPIVESLDNIDPMGSMEDRIADRLYKFKMIYESRLNKLTAEKQEFRIFSRKWGIAGTLDILFSLSGKYYVGDWKTNKKFTDNDSPDGRKQKLLSPFDDLWDNSLTGYSLQISTYRLILEEEAGFKTDGGFLIWLGPKKPKMYKVIDLRDRLRTFLDENNYTL